MSNEQKGNIDTSQKFDWAVKNSKALIGRIRDSYETAAKTTPTLYLLEAAAYAIDEFLVHSNEGWAPGFQSHLSHERVNYCITFGSRFLLQRNKAYLCASANYSPDNVVPIFSKNQQVATWFAEYVEAHSEQTWDYLLVAAAMYAYFRDRDWIVAQFDRIDDKRCTVVYIKPGNDWRIELRYDFTVADRDLDLAKKVAKQREESDRRE